ncbi:MAG TPA: hypothetical protein VGI19_19450 [Candidatus Cybelea sp.]|jgi:hypothetical protein
MNVQSTKDREQCGHTRFANGRGEFYDREAFNGKPIVLRFVFDEITPTSLPFVQSFSADGARSWEPNWIATFHRLSGN